MLIEAFYLKAIIFRVLEIDIRLVRSVNELLPHISVHEIVDIIVRGNFNYCLLLLEFEAIHGEISIVLIPVHPNCICN